jgi:cyclophilin family peptidyl-prolyl cis-trans isomerase
VQLAEHARRDTAGVFARAIATGDSALRRLAVRAVGRLEDPSLAPLVLPMLEALQPSVRREAANALAQMKVADALPARLATERDATVRGALYEGIGRAAAADASLEALLARGLAEPSAAAREGAARGLEAWVRRHGRAAPPQAATLEALRQALRRHADPTLRQLVLLAMTGAGVRDSATLALALRDRDPQVRRLAVAAARQWLDDPHPMVRTQALRSAGSCERAMAALADSSEHVALTAVDLLGDRRCAAGPIVAMADSGRTWRLRAHAVVALAKAAPELAQPRTRALAASPTWQARAWAATAARLLADTATLDALARDTQPNVAEAALRTADQAIRALGRDHAGLVLAAANRLKGDPDLPRAAPALLAALERLSAKRQATLRDPRVAILGRLRELRDASHAPRLQPLLADLDPAVAAAAAAAIADATGRPTQPVTARYEPVPFPDDTTLRGLAGATARIHLRDLGVVTVALLPEEAPATVATFAALAEAGRFAGLTFHRIVPNFVIQGASPGANEYDGLTREFMRDELGFARHARGTLGISTRGRDTGDGQLFVNLVDNFRLDHDYTVFARVLQGMAVVDRVQEGDVIERVEVIRAGGARRPGAR